MTSSQVLNVVLIASECVGSILRCNEVGVICYAMLRILMIINWRVLLYAVQKMVLALDENVDSAIHRQLINFVKIHFPLLNLWRVNDYNGGWTSIATCKAYISMTFSIENPPLFHVGLTTSFGTSYTCYCCLGLGYS